MRSFVMALLAFAVVPQAFGKTVRYELTATRGKVNLSGKKEVDFALMLNGQIPAPTLTFTEGDDAEIVVNNQIPNESMSIHWHGILLPPLMDGVPYVTTPPIRPGESFTFKFKIRQHGTYWYHSHTSVQEQKGLYGAIVIHPRKPMIRADKEVVAVLGDWSDENADQILRNLKKDGDYYMYKKGTIRSWWGALRSGGLGTFLWNEWTRMGGMDLSDVGYDAFLINGRRDSQLVEAKAGEKIRIRLINSAASSYFYVSLGDGPMEVISSDGVDMAPRRVGEILMGMGETYDVLFTVPENQNYELRATVQDGTGFASGWIGAGPKVRAPDRPEPDLYAPMDHSGHEDHGAHDSHGHQGHHGDHGQSAILPTLTVDEMKATASTEFPPSHKRHDLKLVLGGDMERYVWHINGKAIHQDRTITINEGDVIRFTLVNETMMHHPMHLHGHFFRVLNKNGARSPLKHTVDVSPHSTRTIEFLADEPGEWMLHCHNLYHMKTGMARIIKYSTFTPREDIKKLQKHDPHLHDHIYHNGLIEAASNHARAQLRLSKTWDTLEAEVETRETKVGIWEWEGDLLYRRWMSNYFNLALGGQSFDKEQHGVVGFGYTLPLLIETTFLLDHEGRTRLDVHKKFQWTKRVHSDVELSFRQEHKTEFEVTLMYADNWHWSAGLMLTETKLGAGVELRF